jgi:hypothetical protein
LASAKRVCGCSQSRDRRARRPRLAASAAALGCIGTLVACSFDVSPELTERAARAPVTEGVANGDWLETLDHGQTPAPTPNGRADDPQRPQQPGATSEPPPPAAPLAVAHLRRLETRHLGQWTARPPNRVDSLGFTGTDLGISFAHRGQLWFLFGDSQSVFDYSADSLAVSALGPFDPNALPKLDWITRTSGLFAPISAPGVDLGFMNVAVEGVSLGETAYVFLAAGWSDALGHHRASVLAHSDGSRLELFQVDHIVTSQHFLNVSVVVEGPYVYIWGSGEFRKSDVYLARVRADSLADRDAWEYFHGTTAAGPAFVAGEQNAQPIVTAGCVGELSARKHPQLGLFLLAYNCEWPRGVFLHTAQSPAGPYSEPIVLFEPWRDAGYEHFMHVAPSVSGRDDGLSDPDREEQSGGEYGPYLVPQWFTEEPGGGHAIVYTLSSWNPYQVHLMQTVLVDADSPLPPLSTADILSVFGNPGTTQSLALQDESAWSLSGDGFALDAADDGGLVVASDAAPLSAAATGTFWFDFRIDQAASALEFDIQGGDPEVLLLADDEVVRRAHGRNDGVWRPVAFQLAGLHDRALRIALYDQSTESYVRVRNLRLR